MQVRNRISYMEIIAEPNLHPTRKKLVESNVQFSIRHLTRTDRQFRCYRSSRTPAVTGRRLSNFGNFLRRKPGVEVVILCFLPLKC